MSGSELTDTADWESLLRAPEALRALLPAINAFAELVDATPGLTYVGCGSSLDVVDVVAPKGSVSVSGGDAALATQVGPWIAISRSGSTRELSDVALNTPPSFVVTCDPTSELAKRSVGPVLDLSEASDPGFVALTSTLVTLSALILIDSAPSARPALSVQLVDALSRGLAQPTSAAAPAIAWLGNWRSEPLGRELVRKTAESGRSGMWMHGFEFLHGHDLLARGDDWEWVVIDEEARYSSFIERLGRTGSPPVRHLELNSSSLSAVGALTRAYASLFVPSP